VKDLSMSHPANVKLCCGRFHKMQVGGRAIPKGTKEHGRPPASLTRPSAPTAVSLWRALLRSPLHEFRMVHCLATAPDHELLRRRPTARVRSRTAGRQARVESGLPCPNGSAVDARFELARTKCLHDHSVPHLRLGEAGLLRSRSGLIGTGGIRHALIRRTAADENDEQRRRRVNTKK
jgi:hypothetical protein